MKKNAKMLIALVLCASMLLSGCYPGIMLSIMSAGRRSIDEGRGTSLSHNGDKLDINRLERDKDVPMGDEGIWTVFVYMCGSNLESAQAGYCASMDMLEMIDATGECPELRFVIEAGGAEEWGNTLCEGGKSQRLIIEDGGYELLSTDSARNMGEAATLADFISWGVENYASEYMVLDLWDHGGGSIGGVCMDDLYYGDTLLLTEIDAALAEVYDEMTDRFEVIGFDACLMATLEAANILVPYARYMVASEESETGYGWYYGSFASAVNDGAESGADLGMHIGNGYYNNSCPYADARQSATMSVTDLSKVDDLMEAFDAYANDIYKYASSSKSNVTDILRAVKNTLIFGRDSNGSNLFNMIDLGDMLELTRYYSENAQNAAKALEECVVYTKNGSSMYSAHGLSLFYPIDTPSVDALNIFKNICASPYYLRLVDLCVYASSHIGNIDGYRNGDQTGNSYWNGQDVNNSDYDYWNSDDDGGLNFDSGSTGISFADMPQLTDDGYLYFRLTKDSIDNLDTVNCYLIMEFYDSSNHKYWLEMGTDNYVNFDWDTGECYDNFAGTWLALPDGQPLCVYIIDTDYDYDVDEYYNLYLSPVYINDELYYMIIRQYLFDDNWTGEIIGACSYDGTYGSFRDLYRLKNGDRICPYYDAYDPETGDYSTYFYGYDYVYNGNPKLYDELLYAEDYLYGFCLVDLYGNELYTDYASFTVGEDGTIYYNW